MSSDNLHNRYSLIAVLNNNQDFLIVNFLLVVKIVFFSNKVGLGFGSMERLLSSAAILLLLSCWLFFLPALLRMTLLLLYDFFISFVLLADMVFFRFFHNVISIPVLFEAGQVEGVSGSVMALFRRWDWLLLADLLLLIPYFIHLNRKRTSDRVTVLRKAAQVAVVLVLSLVCLTGATRSVAAYFSENAYTGLNWKHTVLQNLGILNFHVYDLYNYVQQRDAKVTLSTAVQPLKDWMSRHRKQGPNNFTGVAKGKNLIIVQIEALQGFLINRSVDGQVITPNLNKLLDSSMYFDNYFTQIAQGNTSDAEFVSLNSLYPAETGSNYIMQSRNTFQALPWVLQANGYTGVYALHGNAPEMWNRTDMYHTEGFDRFYSLKNGLILDDKVSMGLSDRSFYKQAVSLMQSFKQPYGSFLVTLSGHYPYDLPSAMQGLNIPARQYSTVFTNYLQVQNYADKCLGEFIAKLNQTGIMDNSLLVVYGDHFGTGWTAQDVQKLLGEPHPLDELAQLELDKIPLFIRLPGGREAGVKHISGGQIDLFPTLANLLGLNKQNMFYFGQDLLNAKLNESFTAFRYYHPDGSFVTQDLFYIADSDGVFSHGKAYNRLTGQPAQLDLARPDYTRALWELKMSDLIIQTNGLPQLLPKLH
ncbi:MAG: LTA synthase family protein [Peptococcaceae bacterium]|nr:LTA synthase family protein [Peptococcaceae bacterium]